MPVGDNVDFRVGRGKGSLSQSCCLHCFYLSSIGILKALYQTKQLKHDGITLCLLATEDSGDTNPPFIFSVGFHKQCPFRCLRQLWRRRGRRDYFISFSAHGPESLSNLPRVTQLAAGCSFLDLGLSFWAQCRLVHSAETPPWLWWKRAVHRL